ncbi:PREDICTED: uncharacterized protein LOC107195169 [Dufourea novaeangliae]|uniref:uncharacterized protein LOC107195169 n=1 Tax=Dufourea novaeangliae TaxID=178035 RepID=UPI0007671168|nr:PREDICTED: uncharacterized protein LOC107195169 [Dufourea novaeangliae]
MFLYLVALIATSLIIFGLVHARCLVNLLRSSVRASLFICNGLIHRSPIEESFNNEDVENDCTLSLGATEEENFQAQRLVFDNNETSIADNAGKENIFESLKTTIARSTNPSTRLNTTQIYDLIMEETLKESSARQKLLDAERRKFNERVPLKITDHLPSSSENPPERASGNENPPKSDH